MDKAKGIARKEKNQEKGSHDGQKKALREQKAPLQATMPHYENAEIEKLQKNLKKWAFCKLK